MVKHFFDIADFNEWERNTDTKKFTIKYCKGLGSYDKSELQQLISEYGLDYFLEYFNMDDVDVLDRWLSSSRADDRKEELKKFTLDLNMV
jgi:DNA gyrase/topoisomerase IV subunit B